MLLCIARKGILTCALIPAVAQLAVQISAEKEMTLQVTKPSDREIVLTRTFAAPRQTVFDALTQPNHLIQWMQPTNMSLVTCEVDLREGGSLSYVFQRPSGARIEVRGLFKTVDPPHRFVYMETYDFSPLEVRVTTVLDQVEGGTSFKQTMEYASKKERDEDFDGVATSSREVYARLGRYLESLR